MNVRVGTFILLLLPFYLVQQQAASFALLPNGHIQPLRPPPCSAVVQKQVSKRLRAANSRSQEDPFDLVTIEKQVYASAQERIDKKRLLEALQHDSAPSTSTEAPPAEQWKIALAAAAAGSCLSFLVTNNLILSGFVVLPVVFVAANADPLEEDDNNVGGAIARLLGRATIRSVEASQPKVKAVARAVITGEEEIVALKTRMRELEQENQDLRLWKERRIKTEDCLSFFSLEELKQTARSHNLAVGGTKSQLLMRLVEADAIDLSCY